MLFIKINFQQQTLEIFHPAIKLDSTEQIETSNFSDPLGSILDLKILEEKLDEVETKGEICNALFYFAQSKVFE